MEPNFKQRVSEIELFHLLEARRLEAQNQVETLHKRIGDLRDELYEEVASSHKEIMKEIKEMKMESKIHHEKMDERLHSLERWKWGLTAIGIFIGSIVAIASDIAGILP
jgi:hypothetical protein